jgi:hypothetical protein
MSTAKKNLEKYRNKGEEEISEKFKKKIQALVKTNSKKEKMHDAAYEMICDETFQSVLFKESLKEINVNDLKAKSEKIPQCVNAKAKELCSFLAVAAALYVQGNSQKRSQEFLKKVPGAAIPFVRSVNQDIENFRLQDYTLFQYVSKKNDLGDEEAEKLRRTVDPKKPYVPPHHTAT